MSLQGSIETFAVADVLRLLAATSKTGRLQVQGPTRAGTVWVRQAQILGADSSSSPYAFELADVVFQLLRFERGSFRFELDDRPDEEVSPVDIEVVLAEAETMLGEWRNLEARIPSARSWVTLQPELRSDAVTLSPEDWSAVVMISVGRTVADLGAALGLGELPTARLVARLLDLGLVDVGEAPAVPAESVPSVPMYDDAGFEPAAVSAVWDPAPIRVVDDAPVAPAAALPLSPVVPADNGYHPADNGYRPAENGYHPADNGYVLADEGYLPSDGPAQTEPEPAWFAAPVALAPARGEEMYAYPGLAVAPLPSVATSADWLPVLPVAPEGPTVGAAGDAAWIGSLAEAIEQVGASATWPTGGEPASAEPSMSPPVAPTGATALAPVGSFGGPTSLFKSGPPERLAPPPPPPPPAHFDTEAVVGAGAEAGEGTSTLPHTDLEQQLFNLSPRARQAIKQNAGLQQGFPGH